MATRNTYKFGKSWFYDPDMGQVDGASLWQRAGMIVHSNDPHPMVASRQDFDQSAIASNTIGGWTATIATSGTITKDTTNPNGVALITAGAATAGQGVNWQLDNPALKISSGKPVAFEVYLKFTGLTNLKIQTFIGLATAGTTALISSNAVTAVDRIGFQGVTTTGVLTSVCRGGGTAVTGTGLTVVNSTFYRLGFFATSSQVDFYVNGAIVSSLTSQIPTGALAPIIVCQANATDTAAMSLDWMAWAAVRQ